ncbi:hypothetical protein K491DRAFT_636259 [Lophiostoma macrostomum CBS 122681]|uniref:Spindle pole body-associated protein cut12 domain-containing protein n=1 Tax=Lophiostoma macrostomum CBS 122681 TaxID=1314788 RepID=A0A6A6SWL1_9PLEO|nr:hypothetical protein K491DRAFT_636259 [Lophiostoma macrostomum CBS 122681]
MFSWITGPRITDGMEDIQSDPAYDTTFVEPPDTPAHQFAMKAFKQAIFGTPAPETAKSSKKFEKKTRPDAANAEGTRLSMPKDSTPNASPSKKPNGILMTPRTASKEKKTVSFGAHVKDNEGKKIGRSGIPNDCPGKFPSPWTPGTELRAEPASDSKPRTKLTAALYDARTTSQPRSGQKPKSRDDSDITLDLGAPRSESGKYWKDQYESYAERSETQMRQLVKKQQVAKNYAKKKDGEAMEAATRLAEERRRSKNRERETERQNKDLQERLRKTMAENFAHSAEIAALKSRIDTLEKSLVLPSSEARDSKLPFSIFEDANKGSSPFPLAQERLHSNRAGDAMEPPSILLGKPVTSRELPENKENSPPKAQRSRRQTLTDTASRPISARSARPTLGGGGSTDISYLSTKAPQPAAPIAAPTAAAIKPPLSPRKLSPSKENVTPKSSAPAPIFSSPLPQGSPDPWLAADADSPPAPMNRMSLDLPIFGIDNSRPTKPKHTVHTVRNRASRTGIRATKVEVRKAESAKKSRASTNQSSPANDFGTITREDLLVQKETIPVHTVKKEEPQVMVVDSKLGDLKPFSGTSDGLSVAQDKGKAPISMDRKEQAKRRLLERKQKRIGSSTVLQ